MLVSIIIPTYNGAQKLPHIIKAIQEQSSQPEEVIVIVDGSTDNSVSVLHKLQKDYDKIKVVKQENKGRAAVRNKGAYEAKGELLLFFDDDMLPTNNCVCQHLLHHQTISGTILTGAQIDIGDKSRSDLQQYKSYLSYKWSKPLQKEKLEPLTDTEIFITASNFSISSKTFNQLNGFDERLTDAEDYDLAVRAFEKAIPLYFSEKAFAWHDDKITVKSYINRLRQYQKAHEKLAELKPQLYKKGNKFDALKPKGFRKVLFSFLAYSFWVRFIEQENILKLLPKKVRYKLYDIIITANGVYFPEKVRL